MSTWAHTLISLFFVHVLLVFLNSFLQKLRWNVYAFLSENVFNSKDFFLSLHIFIMALCSAFKQEDCIVETFQITSTRIKFEDICPNFFIVTKWKPESPVSRTLICLKQFGLQYMWVYKNLCSMLVL